MSRFYIPHESVRGKTIVVSGEEAHHIIDVMRLKPGDGVVTFDATGREYIGIIKEVVKRSLVIDITEERESSAKCGMPVTLIQAIPKKDKMDYIVEKATELGVRTIAPVFTERTIPKWDKRKMASQAERWRKIAREASKQCGRSDIPEIEEVAYFSDIIGKFKGCGRAFMAALSERAVPFKEALKGPRPDTVTVAIGPEGDFTSGEIEEAVSAGFRLVSLGPRVLKSDTAGLAVLAVLNHEYAD